MLAFVICHPFCNACQRKPDYRSLDAGVRLLSFEEDKAIHFVTPKKNSGTVNASVTIDHWMHQVSNAGKAPLK